MKRLINWLHNEAFGWQIAKTIIGFIVLNFLYLALVIPLFSYFGLFKENPTEDKVIVEILLTNFPLLLIMAAAFEELIFRVIPMSFALSLENDYVVLITVLISSMLFGWTHGGWINVLLQGFGGLTLCLCFLKCGGFSGNFPKAFLCSTTLHALMNMISLAIYLWL